MLATKLYSSKSSENSNNSDSFTTPSNLNVAEYDAACFEPADLLCEIYNESAEPFRSVYTIMIDEHTGK